ncbi:MAG: hypothetical protein Q7R95_00485 [bacterium]|nr:hypothetical protein [bacterium]
MRYNINLLLQKETPLVERLMYFSLNYLRYIIIITQLVVIGVFFYRFQIDQRIIDLKESVDQKKEIIQVVLPLLQEADMIDRRIGEIQKITKNQQTFSLMLTYFLSQFPQSVNLQSLEVTSDSIKASGIGIIAQDIQSFYVVLKKENKFGVVNLQNIKKEDNGYSFVLVASNFK